VIDEYEPDTLADVRLIAYSDEEYEKLRAIAKEYGAED
jgi:hypothetical protein